MSENMNDPQQEIDKLREQVRNLEEKISRGIWLAITVGAIFGVASAGTLIKIIVDAPKTARNAISNYLKEIGLKEAKNAFDQELKKAKGDRDQIRNLLTDAEDDQKRIAKQLVKNAMIVPHVLIDKVGPLPTSASFYSAGSTQVFLVSGSAWTQTQHTRIGVNILIDGNNVGRSVIYCNVIVSHEATVTQRVVAHLPPGPHKIELTAINDATITDAADYFNVLMFDLR